MSVKISWDLDGDRQVIHLSGKMDVTNSAGVQEKIEEIHAIHPDKILSLDLAGLCYISSIGLRAFLNLGKKISDISFVEVSPEVYEILEETGFTSIFPTERMMRRISVEGCTKLSEGANGEIYRLDADTMVKAYREGFTLSEIQNELAAAKKVFRLGIPTAISYDIVRLPGERLGAVYEMLHARTLSQLITEHPERIEDYARQFAGLLGTIHSASAEDGGMGGSIGLQCRDEMMRRLGIIRPHIPCACGDKIGSMLAALPDDSHLVHGDCHAKNIMAGGDGDLYLIDMDSLGMGQPIFEFAALYTTYKAYTHEKLNPDWERNRMITGLSQRDADRLWDLLLKYYFSGTGANLHQVEQQARLLAFVRVMSHFVKKGHIEKAELCKSEIISAAEIVESFG